MKHGETLVKSRLGFFNGDWDSEMLESVGASDFLGASDPKHQRVTPPVPPLFAASKSWNARCPQVQQVSRSQLRCRPGWIQRLRGVPKRQREPLPAHDLDATHVPPGAEGHHDEAVNSWVGERC